MSELIKLDNEYKNWLAEVSKRFRQSQIKASLTVNEALTKFFWSIGKDLYDLKPRYEWGNSFYAKISKDLTESLPDVKSFSPRNLHYMYQFYMLYKEIMHQLDAKIDEYENLHQLDAKLFFLIPWGHTKLIIDRCRKNTLQALYYAKKSLDNNWSRAVLLNFIDSNLYEREGKAITNFKTTLPEIQGDLAQAITKDPYNFDFLTLSQRYNEKELKDALMDNITRFLL